MSTISASQFFFNLGNNDRLTLEASTPIHKAWLTATPEQRKQLRADCMANYIMGKLQCERKAADRILSQSRDDRTKAHQAAYRCANERFTYHVSRDNKKVKPVEHKSNRISRAHREAAQAYLALFEDAKSALAVLRAVAK